MGYVRIMGLQGAFLFFKFCPFLVLFFLQVFDILRVPQAHFLKYRKHRKGENKLPQGTQSLSAC